MSTLVLDWIASQGAVRFTVLDVPDDDRTTVKRVDPGGTLTAIRGYPDGTWHGTSGLGYDYEAPMSVYVRYAIVDQDAKNLVASDAQQTVATNLAVNPGLEGASLDGWNTNSATLYPVTRDTTAPISGTQSALSTRTATSPDNTAASVFLQASGLSGTTAFPITVGQPVTASVDVKCEQADRIVNMYFSWLNAAGGTVTVTGSATNYRLYGTGAANQVNRVSVSGVPPATAVQCRVVLQVFTKSGNALTGERVWMDNLRVSTGPGTLDATNLAQNPIGSGVTITGWWSATRCTIAAGADYLRQTITDATAASFAQRISSTTGTSKITVTPGDTVWFKSQARSSAGVQIANQAVWLDPGGAPIGANTIGTPVTTNPTTFVDVPAISGVAPAGAVAVSVQPGIFGSGPRAINDTFDVRQVQVSLNSALPTYFDGSMPPDGTYVYRWTAASNASTSERWKITGTEQTDVAYFDGDTPAEPAYRYRWTGTVKASTSQRTITASAWPTDAVIFTQTPGRVNGEAWLRDVLQPVLSQPVSVVSTGDEVYTARHTVLDVAGKRTPYVVWDSRQSRQGTITLIVKNDVIPGVNSDSTKRAKLEALFSTGRPLLLSICANKGFKNAYLAIDSVTFTRRRTDAAWLVTMDYLEVDNPTGLGVILNPEVTYAMAQQLPPGAIYQSWAGTGVGTGIRYYDVATRTTVP